MKIIFQRTCIWIFISQIFPIVYLRFTYFYNQKKDLITNEPYNGSYYEHLEIIGEIQLLRLSTKIRFISFRTIIFHSINFFREKYGFKNISIIIDPRTFTNDSFIKVVLKNIIGYKPALINQIIYGFDKLKIILPLLIFTYSFKEIAISDKITSEHYMFPKDRLSDIDYLQNPLSAIYLRIIGVIRIIFGLFLASNIASLYFLFIIVGVPIFILGVGS